MTGLLIHEAPLKAAELKERLAQALSELPTATAEPLLDRLVIEARPTPTLVFTGLHSSGKSMLILALTDGAADVVIDADIATDHVTEYPWDGTVLLVDTPGVRAGVKTHDELAMDALTAADLVVFVITPDMFDDSSAAHLRLVAHGLGKRDQMMIVVNKALMKAADPGVRQAALEKALGSAHTPPLVECDAKLYRQSLSEREPARAASLRTVSKLDELRSQINTFSAQRGDLAMIRQPFQLIRGVAAEAEAALVDDPQEKMVLTWLSRTRSALSQQHQVLTLRLDAQRDTFLRSAMSLAEDFADSLEALDQTPASQWQDRYDQLVADDTAALNKLTETTANRIKEVVDQAFLDISGEMREIEASPQADMIRRFTDRPEAPVPASRIQHNLRMKRRTTPKQGQGGADYMPMVQKLLTQFEGHWGAGSGVKASAGTAGHTITKEVGHVFHKSWKPWQAVRWADNIGKAVKCVGVGLQIGVVAFGVYQDANRDRRIDEDRRARRRAAINEHNRAAEAQIDHAIGEIRRIVDQPFQDSYKQIDAQWDNIVGSQRARGALQNQLREIQEECAGISLDISRAAGDVLTATATTETVAAA